MADILYKIMMMLTFVVVAVGSWYHHSWGCEGLDLTSGKIVVGDSLEEVLEKLNRKDV